jgi:Cysteine-rich CWC
MTGTAAPTSDRCAACGAAFHCGAGDAAPCPCGGITLSPARLAALRRQYKGCLCLDCLRAYSTAAIEDQPCHHPTRPA